MDRLGYFLTKGWNALTRIHPISALVIPGFVGAAFLFIRGMIDGNVAGRNVKAVALAVLIGQPLFFLLLWAGFWLLLGDQPF